MKRKTVIVKKYGNRRLYDTTNSRYINQDEVAQMVREGHEVQVVDAVTGKDFTRLVLTQIVVQHAKEADSAFPLDMLRQMVVASGKATQETAVKYLKTVLDMYQNAYQAMAPGTNPFGFIEAAARPTVPPWAWGPQPAADLYRTGTAPQKNGQADEVGELKRRVEELTSMVSELAAEKTARNRKGKSRRSS